MPGEFHGQRNLAGYSPWGRKETQLSDYHSMVHESTASHLVNRRALKGLYKMEGLYKQKEGGARRKGKIVWAGHPPLGEGNRRSLHHVDYLFSVLTISD